jgi:hypothetical protein
VLSSTPFPCVSSRGLVLVLILFVSLIQRRSCASPRFRGNLLYARYVVFRPFASARRGVPTLAVSSEDSPSRCSYGARQRPTHTDTHARARACKARRRRVRFYRRGGPECSLLHLFRVNSPLKTAYTPPTTVCHRTG